MFGFISYPEKLKYVRIITLKEYSDELTSLLHELGIMHVEELKKVPEDELIILRKKLSLADELAKLVKFVEGYVGATKLVEVKGDLNIAELEKEFLNTFHIVKSLKEKLEVIANNINEVKNRLGEYGNLIKYLRLYLSSCGNTYLKNLDFEGDLVFAKLVKVKRDQLNNILTTLNVVRAACVADVSEEEALTNFLGFKEELKKFKELINESKAEVIEVPNLDLMIQDYINELESKTIKLKSTVDGLEVELNRLVNENLELLAKAKVLYELYVERIEKILDSLMSEYSYVVEGWIPEGNHENLINTLYGRFKYIYVEELKPANIIPPTKLSNRSPVKYFELITRLYGIPRYGEWDPTTLITYSFFIFFGLMTADAVYGLVLLLILKYVLD
ncbi:MAG: V-type ATPase 116kDa subunit family protein, partial [Sulfolobales archaeon]